MTAPNPTITITKEQFLNNFFKYLEDNKNAPKNEQTTAYKNLEEIICKDPNVTMDDFIDYLKKCNGVD